MTLKNEFRGVRSVVAIAALRGAGTQLFIHASHLALTRGFIKTQRTAEQILLLFIPTETRRSSTHMNRWERRKRRESGSPGVSHGCAHHQR